MTIRLTLNTSMRYLKLISARRQVSGFSIKDFLLLLECKALLLLFDIHIYLYLEELIKKDNFLVSYGLLTLKLVYGLRLLSKIRHKYFLATIAQRNLMEIFYICVEG